MSSPYTQLFIHLVWATWQRNPMITPALEQPLYAAITAQCEEHRCKLIAIGGMAEHMHVLVQLSTTIAIATLVKEMKGASSHLMTHIVDPMDLFKWQPGYGAFSVSKNHLRRVVSYIHNQKIHHATDHIWPEWERIEYDEA